MPLTREDFLDLSLVELLQNIHGYHEDLICWKEIGRTIPVFLYNYLQWCEVICLSKWDNECLPSFWFVRQRLIINDLVFEPPAPADVETYFDFLYSQRNSLMHLRNDWNIL